jgi:hypothetical protein
VIRPLFTLLISVQELPNRNLLLTSRIPLCGGGFTMSTTTFEIAAGSSNLLRVPREARDYISEKGESRSFNLDSFELDRSFEPHQVVIHLRIAKKGAEQLTPFEVILTLGEPAAGQLSDALAKALTVSRPQ